MKDSKHWRQARFLFWTVMILFIAMVCIWIHSSSYEDTKFTFDNYTKINDGWSYVDEDGVKKTVQLPGNVENTTGKPFTMSRKMIEKRTGTTYLCIRSSIQGIEIYVEDTCIYTYGIDSKALAYGECPPSAWNLVQLPEDYEGKVISIVLHSPEGIWGEILNEVRIGERSAILYDIFKEQSLQFLCAILVFVMGIIQLALWILTRKHEGAHGEIIYGGIFAILLSIWLFAESKLMQFFIGDMLLVSTLSFISMSLMIIPFLSYLKELKDYHFKEWLTGWQVILCVTFLMSVLLQGMGIVNSSRSAVIIQTIMSAAIVFVVVTMAEEFFKYKSKEIYFELCATACIGFCGIREIYIYIFKTTKMSGIWLSLGAFTFTLLLVLKGVLKTVETIRLGKRAEYFKKLSHMDSMANCLNRTAYNEQLSEVRKEGTTILMADLNDLKKINDVWGHIYGDEAILSFSEILKRNIDNTGSSYRVGGDEFVCILKGYDTTKLQVTLKNIRNDISLKNQTCKYEFDVAIGCATFDETQDETIMDTIRRADQQMYINKRELKREKCRK